MALELDERYGDSFFIILQKRDTVIFKTISWIVGTRNQVPDRAFPLKFL